MTDAANEDICDAALRIAGMVLARGDVTARPNGTLDVTGWDDDDCARAVENWGLANTARDLVAEVKRLRSGGCARDQRTTQFCAEAARLAMETDRLRAMLLKYKPTEAELDVIEFAVDRERLIALSRHAPIGNALAAVEATLAAAVADVVADGEGEWRRPDTPTTAEILASIRHDDEVAAVLDRAKARLAELNAGEQS